MDNVDLEFLNSQGKNVFFESRIKVISKAVDNNDAAIAEIKNFSPVDGWLSLQSSPAKRVRNADFDAGDERIIAGEFYNSNGLSLSVRYDGEKWIFVTCHEAEDGELVVKRNVQQLSKIRDNTYLDYEVFYNFDADFGYRPYCSAFKGFSEKK